MVVFMTARRGPAARSAPPPETGDTGPVPIAFFAATLNVYVVPLLRPVTTSATAAVLYVWAGCATAPLNGVTT